MKIPPVHVIIADKERDIMKLIKQAVIPASICDPNIVLGVKGTFDLMQDYLTEMLAALELDGVSLRAKYGCVWVFTRNRVVIDRPLRWKESYTVESFISSAKGAKMTVDTALKDENGEICVYSRIEMCALDLAAQRIKRIREVGVGSDTHVEEPYRDIEFSRMKHEGLAAVDTVRVKSGDIDFVRHTNNVSYVRFIMDTYSVDELRERPVREIEIRYSGQTHEGDILTVRRAVSDGRELFDVALGDTVAAECEIIR